MTDVAHLRELAERLNNTADTCGIGDWHDAGRDFELGEHAERYREASAALVQAATQIEMLQEQIKAIEGWILVPKEPTLEMKEAAGRYRETCNRTGCHRTYGGYYRAMIAAAPRPPEV